ncbi:MAG: isopentenyl-diphosphate Delta-isomerase [Candidatus Pacebacteria bacterium]|nr:isopentenyl-diphosphate Delta-isomerase [Candidatus Paceibacterota bacterium]
MEKIILVDENDNKIGEGEKIEIHKKGLLHRAFSIFIFDPKKEKILLQKRHKNKYHSGGLWTNTCCSHPRVGEKLMEAAHRRLKEEMGFDCELKELFSFIYKADFGKIKEYEKDYVVVGCYEGEVCPNPDEVEEWKWVKIDEVLRDLKENPEKYTVWFRLSFEKVVNLLN